MSNEQNQHVSMQEKQSLTRRLFLKWGTIGGLTALPLGVIAYRKLKANGYEYLLKGPFQLEKDSYYYFQKEDWIGDSNNKGYIPCNNACLCMDNSDEPIPQVTLWVTFEVKKDVPDTFGANVTISAVIKNKSVISELTQWDAPHKKWVLNPEKMYNSHSPDNSMVHPLPFVSTYFKFPLKLLQEIDLIRFYIEEYSIT
ncbi:MAG: hypothetical protein LBG58_10360 [Planctomycetaceae bacterium]|jgi:hypothetical protein|nr:hypothetical protein [Planctomycetaceae bacterium]